MRLTKENLLGVALFLAWVIAVFLWFPRHPDALYQVIDFPVFLQAGLRAIHHQTVYDPTVLMQFKYAPFVAYLFGITMGRLPLAEAVRVHYPIFFVGWWVLILFITREVVRRFAPEMTALKLSTGLIVFSAFFGATLAEELTLGQVNLIPVGLLFAFFALYEKELRGWRLFWATTALSLAFQFKLYVGLAGPFLLMRKDFRVILWTAASVLFFNLGILSLIHGPAFAISENLRWLVTLTHSTADLLTWRYNASLVGDLLKVPFLAWAAKPAWLALLGIFLGIQWRIRDRDPLLSYAWVLSAIVLLNPLVWSNWGIFHFPMLLLVLLAAYERREGISGMAWVVSIATLLAFAIVINAHESRLNRDGGLAIASVALMSAFAWGYAGQKSHRALTTSR